MGTLLISVLLTVVWAGVLVYWVRTRRPLENLSIGFGSRGAGALGRDIRRAPVVALRGAPAVRPGGAPRGRVVQPVAGAGRSGLSSEQARVRRRAVLVGLAAFALLTLVMAVSLGGAWLVLHLLADAALLGFVVVVVAYQRAVEASRLQVRPLHRAADLRPPLVATGTDGRPVLRRAR